MPHTNKNRFPNSNIKFLMEKTSKIIHEKGKRGNNSYKSDFMDNQNHKKNRYRAIKGRPFSRSLNSWVSSENNESNDLSQSKRVK